MLHAADHLDAPVHQVVQLGEMPVLGDTHAGMTAWPGSLVPAPFVGPCTDSSEGHGAPP